MMAKVVISIIGMLCAAWAIYSYVTARLIGDRESEDV